MFTLDELDAAAARVHAVLPPTPEFAWPLLAERAGTEVWVKHENHTAIGAFKVRGGLCYLSDFVSRRSRGSGVITATRGNHGQSIGYAARRLGVRATIVVPHGNSREKNRAMRALGVELIEHGHDFQAAAEYALGLAGERGLEFIPSYHPLLVLGVAAYALEFLRAVPNLSTVYVPVGMGSGICGMIAARDALGLPVAVVGVVAAGAPAYALSVEAGRVVSTERADTIADGVACRTPNPDALAVIRRGAARVVTVSDGEICEAMRHYFADTHNVAEGAGAAPLAALLKEGASVAGPRVGLVLSGGNVDTDLFAGVLDGRDP